MLLNPSGLSVVSENWRTPAEGNRKGGCVAEFFGHDLDPPTLTSSAAMSKNDRARDHVVSNDAGEQKPAAVPSPWQLRGVNPATSS